MHIAGARSPAAAPCAGASYVIPARTVFEAANGGTGPAEAYVVAFVPAGTKVKVEAEPAGC